MLSPWDQRVAAAGAKFKQHPRFLSVERDIHAKSLKLGEKFPPPLTPLSAESAECAKLLFVVHCDAYLAMVDNRELLDAYSTMLQVFLQKAWEQYSGIPYHLAMAEEVAYFQQIAAAWKDKGRERVMSIETTLNPTGTPTTEPQTKTTTRRSLEPNPALLEGKETVNRKQAASALGISDRTIDRWIADGKLTAVGTSSRKRFRSKDLLRILSQKQTDK